MQPVCQAASRAAQLNMHASAPIRAQQAISLPTQQDGSRLVTVSCFLLTCQTCSCMAALSFCIRVPGTSRPSALQPVNCRPNGSICLHWLEGGRDSIDNHVGHPLCTTESDTLNTFAAEFQKF
jgi:hypothetical protein